MAVPEYSWGSWSCSCPKLKAKIADLELQLEAVKADRDQLLTAGLEHSIKAVMGEYDGALEILAKSEKRNAKKKDAQS